ncbi:unnamed protein product [Nippostrongylus brasiliensis]|uniref:Melanophilin n=1 Tax=Nippostrongylus brasiliensis TaxID=27835 RepID=A0A0N4YCA4_NIPBR|nr:unnamed protein product [Nippostrongylus brasiliensis]
MSLLGDMEDDLDRILEEDALRDDRFEDMQMELTQLRSHVLQMVQEAKQQGPSTSTDIPSAEKKPHQGFNAYYLKDPKGKRKEFDHLMKQTGRRHNERQESRSRGRRHLLKTSGPSSRRGSV